MKIYFACPTGQRRDMIVDKYGDTFGACLTRDIFNDITATKMSYFLDNGAFKDYKDGVENSSRNYVKLRDKFLNRLELIRIKFKKGLINMPDFVVVPDIVGNKDSYMYSRSWINLFKEDYPEFKYYLAAQNGMRIHHKQDGNSNPYCIEIGLKMTYDGLFVGGTKDWKYKTSQELIELAKKYNKPCHIGGIGTRKSILWAKSIGADSVDSGVAMIHPVHLKEVLNIQNDLFWNIA